MTLDQDGNQFDQAAQMRLFGPAKAERIAMNFEVVNAKVAFDGVSAEDTTLTSVEVDRRAVDTLKAAGINVTDNAGLGPVFSAAEIPLLLNLNPAVEVSFNVSGRALWDLVKQPPSSPVLVDVTDGESLRISWDGPTGPSEGLLHPVDSPALFSLDFQVVASAPAWATLEQFGFSPAMRATVTKSVDGHLVLTSSRPQQLESAGLPAAWKIDSQRLGMPCAYLPHLKDDDRFVIDPSVTVPARRIISATELDEFVVELSQHHRSDIDDIVGRLSAYRAVMVRWAPGLGRRLFALTAAQLIGSKATLVVTPPSTIWAWARHAELLGLTWSLSHNRADIRLVTPHDLSLGINIEQPDCLVVDAISSEETLAARAALLQTAAWRDCYRIGVDSHLPADPGAAVEVMELLVPGEFNADIPLQMRYTSNAVTRAGEHIAVYVAARNSAGPQTDHEFRRSSVKRVECTPAQTAASDLAYTRHSDDVAGVVTELMEIATCGSAHTVAPKLATAAELVRSAEGRVAVLTRHRRAAQLLKTLLRPAKVRVVDAAAGSLATEAGVPLVIRFDRTIADLSNFDTVIVCDLPFSLEELEIALGPASENRGPSQITVLHTPGTIDDRLSVMAALRAERSAATDGSSPLSTEEVSFLLRR